MIFCNLKGKIQWQKILPKILLPLPHAKLFNDALIPLKEAKLVNVESGA